MLVVSREERCIRIEGHESDLIGRLSNMGVAAVDINATVHRMAEKNWCTMISRFSWSPGPCWVRQSIELIFCRPGLPVGQVQSEEYLS